MTRKKIRKNNRIKHYITNDTKLLYFKEFKKCGGGLLWDECINILLSKEIWQMALYCNAGLISKSFPGDLTNKKYFNHFANLCYFKLQSVRIGLVVK